MNNSARESPRVEKLLSLSRLLLSSTFRVVAVIAFFAIDALSHPGWGLIVSPHGDIIFGDVNSNTIWRFDRNRELNAIATGKHSHSLFLDEEGNLVGEHVFYDETGLRWISSIWKLKPDGQLVDLIAPTSRPPRGSGVFMDPAGNIYSVQGGAPGNERTELLRKAPDGTVTVFAGGERGHADGYGTQAKFNYVVGMAWGTGGMLYVSDGSSIRRVAPDGSVMTVGGDPLAGVPRSENPRLLGLTVDSHENIFVADYEYRCVRQISPDGAVSTSLSEGVFWSPSGVTAVENELYVLEHQPESVVGILGALGVGPYARVRKISADGTVSTILTLWGKNTTVGIACCLVVVVVILLGLRGWRRRRKK
jgi:sugar lactone lactonase YvrE